MANSFWINANEHDISMHYLQSVELSIPFVAHSRSLPFIHSNHVAYQICSFLSRRFLCGSCYAHAFFPHIAYAYDVPYVGAFRMRSSTYEYIASPLFTNQNIIKLFWEFLLLFRISTEQFSFGRVCHICRSNQFELHKRKCEWSETRAQISRDTEGKKIFMLSEKKHACVAMNIISPTMEIFITILSYNKKRLFAHIQTI